MSNNVSNSEKPNDRVPNLSRDHEIPWTHVQAFGSTTTARGTRSELWLNRRADRHAISHEVYNSLDDRIFDFFLTERCLPLLQILTAALEDRSFAQGVRYVGGCRVSPTKLVEFDIERLPHEAVRMRITRGPSGDKTSDHLFDGPGLKNLIAAIRAFESVVSP